MTSPNPFVFVVGCPRSGTTLLRRMIDAHPQIAVTPETHWLPTLFEQRVGLGQDDIVTPELARAVTERTQFARLGIAAEEIAALTENGRNTYSSFVASIFDLYGSKRGKRLVGDKTPGYVRRIPLLHALWPRAKFVHLIRDGRAVALSALSWEKGPRTAGRFSTWSADPMATAGLWWEWHVRLGQEAGSSLSPGTYLEVSYETLVDDPGATCARVCGFLGVEYSDDMVRFHEGRRKTKPGLDAKHAWLPVTPGLRNFRREIPEPDLTRLEAIIGGLLEELGYEPAAPDADLEAAARGARLRSRFSDDLRARRRPQPVRW